MLDRQEATLVVQKNLPEGDIQNLIEYQDLYVFQVFSPDPDEGQYDPFFSVHMETGEFRDFSILKDGNTAQIIALFLEED
jgi:hypothetical protein